MPRPRYANGHISAMGDPIHFMFGSRVGFSGTADLMALFSSRPNSRWRPPPSWIISNGHISATAHDLQRASRGHFCDSTAFLSQWCWVEKLCLPALTARNSHERAHGLLVIRDILDLSVFGSRLELSWSRDVIGHVTIRFPMDHFLLVLLWNQAYISITVSEIFNGDWRIGKCYAMADNLTWT